MDLTPEQIAQLQTDAANAKAEAARVALERDEYKTKFEANISDRDKAKERERKALEERGEYAAATDALKAELAEAKLKAEESAKKAARADELETQLKAIEDATRAELLEQIPEADREEWKALPTAAIRLHVKAVSATPPNTSGVDRGKARPASGVEKPWAEMNDEEMRVWTSSHTPEELTAKLRKDGIVKSK